MKKICTLFILVISLSFQARSQLKTALILSSHSQVVGEEKLVARNNFNLVNNALALQGFAAPNIFTDTNSLDLKTVRTWFDRLISNVRRGDFILVYADLPAGAHRYPDGSWEKVLYLNREKTEFIGMKELSIQMDKIAQKAGDHISGLFLTILDTDTPPSLEPENRRAIDPTRMPNLLVATMAGQKRVIRDHTSLFTKAVANCLSRIKFKDFSYRNLVDNVNREMILETTLQRAVFDGDPNQALFRGLFLPSQNFHTILSMSDSLATINAGYLIGLEKGSNVRLYKIPDTPGDPAATYLEGTVISATSLTSVIDLPQPIGNFREYWVFPDKKVKPARLQFNDSYINAPPAEIKTLIAALKKWSTVSEYIEFVDKGGDLSIAHSRSLSGDSVEYTLVNPSNGFILERLSMTRAGADIEPLKEIVKKHSRFKEVYRLNNQVPEISLEAALVPSGKPNYDNGFIVCHEHQGFTFVLTNKGSTPLYFNLVDLLGDRSLKVLAPDGYSTPEDYRIGAGAKIEMEMETDGYSFGPERLKVLAAPFPIDLRHLVNRTLTRSAGSRVERLNYEDIHIIDLDFEIRSAGYARSLSERKSPELSMKPGPDKGTEVSISNRSQEHIYFNLLKQQEDGAYTVVYPARNLNPYDCFVPYEKTGVFSLPSSCEENDQLIAVYSDRPFYLPDYIDKEKDLNALLLEMMRESRIAGTALNKLAVVQAIYNAPAITASNRNGGELSIRLITPKLAGERALGLKTKTRSFELAGMAYAEALKPVTSLKINGEPAPYDQDLKLFEKTIQLQSGINRVVIEATDEKGFTVTKKLEIEMEGDKTVERKEGRNYFLGIGINQYQHWDPLSYAVSDIRKFSELLESKFGFKREDMLLLLDTAGKRRNIINQIRQFLTKAGPNDNVIIYLAGHGNEDQLADGDYYFIAQESEPADVTTAVKSTDILDNFKRIKAKHCLLILDACYAGMISNSVYGIEKKTLNSKETEADPSSKWIITSGRATKVLDKSPFAAALVNYLRENDDPSKLRIRRLIEYLEDEVPKVSHQKPWGDKIEGEGEMIFKKGGK